MAGHLSEKRFCQNILLNKVLNPSPRATFVRFLGNEGAQHVLAGEPLLICITWEHQGKLCTAAGGLSSHNRPAQVWLHKMTQLWCSGISFIKSAKGSLNFSWFPTQNCFHPSCWGQGVAIFRSGINPNTCRQWPEAFCSSLQRSAHFHTAAINTASHFTSARIAGL